MLLPGLTRIDLTTAYHRFSLVLLDEATSALDIATETKLLEALRALAEKLTIVMVAHRLRSLANCDKLVDLSKKRVALLARDELLLLHYRYLDFERVRKRYAQVLTTRTGKTDIAMGWGLQLFMVFPTTPRSLEPHSESAG